MTQATSWYIRRMEKGVEKRERKIQKLREKITDFEHRHEAGKITRAKYEMKKKDLEAKIRQLSARVNTYKGAIGKERHRIAREGE